MRENGERTRQTVPSCQVGNPICSLGLCVVECRWDRIAHVTSRARSREADSAFRSEVNRGKKEKYLSVRCFVVPPSVPGELRGWIDHQMKDLWKMKAGRTNQISCLWDNVPLFFHTFTSTVSRAKQGITARFMVCVCVCVTFTSSLTRH